MSDTKDKVRKINENIVLDGEPLPVVEDIVKMLEHLLEQAKSGELQEFAFVSMYSDFAGDFQNPSAMIGEIDVLKDNYKTIRHPNVYIMVMEREE